LHQETIVKNRGSSGNSDKKSLNVQSQAGDWSDVTNITTRET